MRILAFALSFAVGSAAFCQAPHDGTAAMPAKQVVPSKSLAVVFEGKTANLTVEDLLALPQVTVHVRNAHSNTEEAYTGPLVADVLARAGLTSTRETQPLLLHSNVIATGADKYFVVYSAAELQPAFATGKAIVAVMRDDLPNTAGGNIQLVNSADAKPARWVHGLASLSVVTMKQN